jgi:hypothetical protein
MSRQVRYSTKPEKWVQLEIPVDRAVNSQEVQEYQVRATGCRVAAGHAL